MEQLQVAMTRVTIVTRVTITFNIKNNCVCVCVCVCDTYSSAYRIGGNKEVLDE